MTTPDIPPAFGCERWGVTAAARARCWVCEYGRIPCEGTEEERA